jgi:hypothetical protein
LRFPPLLEVKTPADVGLGVFIFATQWRKNVNIHLIEWSFSAEEVEIEDIFLLEAHVYG